MRYTLFFVGVIAVLTNIYADAFTDYRLIAESSSTAQSTNTGDMFANLDFEQDNKRWNIGVNDKVQNAFGRNGTAGLKVYRDAASSKGNSSRTFKLPPGVKFTVGGWIRTEDVKGEGAAIAVELYQKDGKFISGRGKYLTPVSGTKDWTRIETIMLSDNNPETQYMLSLYMRPWTTGTAYFDDIFICEEKPQWLPYILHPKMNTVDPEKIEFKLQSAITGRFEYDAKFPAELYVSATIKIGDKAIAEQQVQIINNSIMLDFGCINITGDAVLALTLFDRANKVILAKKNFEITFGKILAEVTVDAIGRTIVDGKPFLTLALYGYGLNKDDVKILSTSPFNAFLPYPSLFLDIESNNGVTNNPSIEKINETLNYCKQNGIRIIFSLKDLYDGYKYAPKSWNALTDKTEIVKLIVNGIKNNPGLLMWYIADEQNPDYAAKLKERRRLIASLDKNHPALTVFYQYSELALYGECQDILGVDPYPIKFAKDNQMKNVYDTSVALEKAVSVNNIPLGALGVPQIHNQGLYEADKNDYNAITQKYRAPAKDEILAMSLMEAIHGARGFVFYSYHDLRRGPDKEQFTRRWPDICAAAAEIKALEKFLLSDIPAVSVSMNTRKGLIAAKRFTANDGSVCVLIAATGPGASETVINNLPSGLTSLTGRTIATEAGYKFVGTDISYDILISNKE